MNTDVDAVVYMMLMNNMIHDLFPNAVVIGETQHNTHGTPMNGPPLPALHCIACSDSGHA